MHALNTSAHYIKSLHQTQTEATLAASHLVETITHLTAVTQDEFSKINASASSLKQTLIPESRPFAQWWATAWPWVVQAVLRGPKQSQRVCSHTDFTLFLVDPERLAYLPTIRILSTSCGVLYYVLRFALSAITVSLTGSQGPSSGRRPLTPLSRVCFS